ncbi:hypothetical protein THAOC_00681 [Thalassiosira oceanica]|uniref:Uncharacterized protein n=1 Tax=Thalassiosira oceanica TaxID=159749 RepID=K0TFC7_THAOC|nr:hypothetical protein THAOC_00681 [Thalassiosira oceanica]|eukprot:EJK77488.1 hypothetical protein THAOC_00681 [Thalassiosira oceanica]
MSLWLLGFAIRTHLRLSAQGPRLHLSGGRRAGPPPTYVPTARRYTYLRLRFFSRPCMWPPWPHRVPAPSSSSAVSSSSHSPRPPSRGPTNSSICPSASSRLTPYARPYALSRRLLMSVTGVGHSV